MSRMFEAAVNGRQLPQVAWLISGHDFREHGFADVDKSQGFLEALCEHSVPPEKVVDPTDTVLTPQKCHACLLIFGDMVADALGAPHWPHNNPE